jgi:uncharacterized protein (DUF433 family)
MKPPDFLHKDENGEIRLAGQRIGLFHVIHYYRAGYSPEMLACQFPTLPLALIHKVIAYYLDHTPEVEAYVNTCRTELAQQRAAKPQPLDAATLRQRLEAMQHVEGS